MNKLFQRIIWKNNDTPALNENNLNAMSKGLDDIDDRVITLASQVMEVVPQIQEYLAEADSLVDAMETLSQNPPYIGENGNWWVFDTDTEEFEDSGIDASITVNIADITMLDYGTVPYVTNTGTNTDPVFHLFIPRAAGVSRIEKTATSGLTDTYTMTFADGAAQTFEVQNGEAFSVYKSYRNITAMREDIANVPEGKHVIISNRSSVLNGWLYVRETGERLNHPYFWEKSAAPFNVERGDEFYYLPNDIVGEVLTDDYVYEERDGKFYFWHIHRLEMTYELFYTALDDGSERYAEAEAAYDAWLESPTSVGDTFRFEVDMSGPQGAKGIGIFSIIKTATDGLVDTYTITYHDNSTTTFTVTNGEKGDAGNGIASITRTGTEGAVDTYTITMTDGSTHEFTVTNGTGSEWRDVTGKPFDTIGSGLEVEDGVLKATEGGVKSFNGRSGSVLPVAGDYDSSQITHEANSTVEAYLGKWTTPVSCLTGDTSVTISNDAIHTTSVIRAYSETASGTPVGLGSMVVSEGQAVITFASALAEAANIRLQILNI